MNNAFSINKTRREIIALTYQGLDAPELFRRVSSHLRPVVDFDADHWLVTDPDTILPVGLLSDHFPFESGARVAENELLEDDFNKLGLLARDPGQVGILGQSTGGKPELSRRYRDFLVPAGWEHELRAALVSDSRCWGFLCLHRGPQKPDFSRSEAAFIARIGKHLAEGIRRTMLMPTAPIINAPEAPGLIILDDQMSVETMTPLAENCLEDIGGYPRLLYSRLPEVVYSVAARARALSQADGPESIGMARARVRTRSGRWLVVHGSTLRGPAHMNDHTAVVIETAHPAEVMSLVIEGFDLSERERQVMLWVMKGTSTGEMARELHISPYTVQEHLKSIFQKTGARSRRELVGQVFFDRYFPRLDPRSLS